MRTIWMIGFGLAFAGQLVLPSSAHAQAQKRLEQQFRSLIPQASSMDRKQFEKLAKSPNVPKKEERASTSLSTELLFLNTQKIKNPKSGFHYLTKGPPQPVLIAREMYRTIGVGRLAIVTHPVTMIQANRITRCDVKVSGENAKGTFAFNVPKLYEGQTEFSAVNVKGKWVINEFRMAGVQVHVRLNKKGQWENVPAKKADQNRAPQDGNDCS